jgi:RNA polymerase sigma factor (sigma-70 family)
MDLIQLEQMETDDIIIEKEKYDILIKCLNNLKPTLKEVIYKRIFENKTYKQIGDELNTSTERVRQRYCQGLRSLRGKMECEYR